jgi:hypothetical protein
MSAEPARIPDMGYINRKVPIVEVARALDLRLDGSGKIHCWHPDRHKNGDRTASVGIRTTNNTVKCFGCDFRPIGPIDLVMDVRAVSAVEAALWIAGKFSVPMIPAGKRLEGPDHRRDRFGYDQGLGLLVKSGLWGTLSEAARSVAPVLLEMSEKNEPTDQESSIQLSYAGLHRYSGISSPNSVRKALVELEEIGFLVLPEAGFGRSPERRAARYIVTPNSDALTELAHAFSAQRRAEVAAERELRDRLRKQKIRGFREANGSLQRWAGQEGSNAAPLPHTPIPAQREEIESGRRISTKYKPVYPRNSANQQDAIRRIERNLTSARDPNAEVNG